MYGCEYIGQGSHFAKSAAADKMGTHYDVESILCGFL